MKNQIKSFESFVTNEKIGTISGISGGFGDSDEEDSDEMKAVRAQTVADMRKEVGSDLPEFEEESSSISVDSEENLPTIDIDKILYDYANDLNQEEKKEFAKKLYMHVQYLRSVMARD